MGHLHHVGLVVPPDDFDSQVSWWCAALKAEIIRREPWNEPNAAALGMWASRVVIAGVLLRMADGSCIEIHAFGEPDDGRPVTRRTQDLGVGHFAIGVGRDEMEVEGARLAALGVEWFAPAQEIVSGPLAGVIWRYGLTPLGVTLELCYSPS